MSEQIDIPGLPNQLHPEPGYVSGGQPTADQLQAASRAGLKKIINLRPPSEDAGYDEASEAARLQLDYAVLGIAGPKGLTEENARKLDELLSEGGDAPTLVHCASGNRVGALMALRAAWLHDKSREEALETGRRWGLTKMEAVVRQLLA